MPTTYVRKFYLLNFLRYAATDLGKLSSSWYLWNISVGNEIWSGGNNLATTWFRVNY